MDSRIDLKFEGPIPGGDLPQCAVLRCDREGAYVATLESEAAWEGQRLLCQEHRDAIAAGHRWRWDKSQGVYLVGEDVERAVSFEATTYSFSRGSDVDSELGWGPIDIELTNRHEATLQFTLGRALAHKLSADLKLFGREPEDE